MRLPFSVWLLAALAATCVAQWQNWDPSREGTGTDSLESALSTTTTLPSDDDIFNALTQKPFAGRFFWTGRTGACHGEEDSIKGLAEFLATDIDHTTMEVMLRKARVDMPSFVFSPEARAKWQYAAQVYAQNAATTAYVLKGKCVRDGNVWDTIEFPALRTGGTNNSVDCIFEISSEQALIVELLWQRYTDNATVCQQYLNETRAAIACNVHDSSWWSRGKGQQPGGPLTARYFQRLVGPARFWWIGGAIEEPQTSLPWQYWYSLDASLTKPYFGDAACIRKMHATFESEDYQTSKFPDNISLTDDRLTGVYDYWGLCPAHYRDVNRFGGLHFRIMPLGDSITYGYRSSDGNGYRAYVETNLAANNTVEFIGSVHSGSMANNSNEGHPGAEINAISSYANGTLKEKPNLVLLMAGTNDINNNDQVDTAPDRLAALIDKIISTCPDAVVIVATIPAIANATAQARADAYNAGLWSVAMRRSGEGKKVLVADMSNVNVTDLADGLHPNDLGYKLMGQSWLDAIGKACSLGWITAPVEVAASTGPTSTGSTRQECPRLVKWIEQGEIANGAGLGTDLYAGDDCASFFGEDTTCFCNKLGELFSPPYQVNKGTVTNCNEFSYNYTHAVRLADLNGDGRDEYIWLHDDGAVTVFENLGWTYINGQTGNVTWWPRGEIATGVGGRREQIHFADINGDRRADYLWVRDDGSVSMWLNVLSDPSDIKNITWVEQGVIATGIGKTGAGVRFADLNGDNRSEYLYVDLHGAITAYLNGGHTYVNTTTGSVLWIEQGVIATGVGATRYQIRLADINGDGRADYLVVGDDSSVKLWQNQGGLDNGPNAAKVGWWQRGTIATGVGDRGTHIVFGDLNGDGRAEYLDINNATSAVKAWLNGC